jgi:hypothetical protein
MLMTLLFSSLTAGHAIVLDPVFHAAEEMGYQVVGDLEFRPGSARIAEPQMRENLKEIDALCPTGPLRENHFVILAWSDREYPSAQQREAESSSAQVHLADERTLAVEESLRQHLAGAAASFERVNMATRTPQRLRPGSRAHSTPGEVKQVLKLAGAAPSGELELGLFGEYGQHSKALIWVDCIADPPAPRRISRGDTFQLARAGANWGLTISGRGI